MIQGSNEMRAATGLLAWRPQTVSPAERYSKLGLVYGSRDLGLFFVPTGRAKVRTYGDFLSPRKRAHLYQSE
jgi:hypothetical protein